MLLHQAASNLGKAHTVPTVETNADRITKKRLPSSNGGRAFSGIMLHPKRQTVLLLELLSRALERGFGKVRYFHNLVVTTASVGWVIQSSLPENVEFSGIFAAI